MTKKSFAVLAAMGLTAGSGVAMAAEFAPFARTGIVYSDNISRLGSHPDAATMFGLELGANLSVETESNYARINAAATGYTVDSAPAEYRDEVLGKIDADWLFDLVPERLQWVTAESFGQVAGRSYQQIQPGNREDVNVFSSGPQFAMELGPKTSLGASLRYLKTDYSRTALDNHGHSAALSATWKPTELQSYSLHAERERTDFSSSLLESDSVRRIFGRWELFSRRSQFVLQAGASRLETASKAHDEPTYLASLNTAAGAYSNVQLLASRSFEGASARARLGSLSGTRFIDAGTDSLLAADQAIVDRWLANWITHKSRGTLRLSGFVTKSRYINSTQLDRTLTGADVSYGRQILPGTEVVAHLEYDRDRTTGSGAVASLINPGIEITRSVSTRIAAAIAVDYYRQRTNQSIGEWRVAFTLQYPGRVGVEPGIRGDQAMQRLQQEGTDFVRRPVPPKR